MSSNLICLIKRSNSAIDLCVNIKELDTLISSLLNNSHRLSLTDDKLTTFTDPSLDKSDRFILTDEEKYLVRQIQSRLKSESASINSNAHPLGQLVL